MSAEISILAGGWSARQFDLARLPGVVIGVNEGCIQARADIGLTMDRLWAEQRVRLAKEKGIQIWIRRSAMKNIGPSPKIRVFDNDHISTVMTDEHMRLNGTSSGMCALNLAYQLRPDRVYLFGFDCNRSPEGLAYWHAPHPWAKPVGATGAARYAVWAAEFALIAPQMAMVGIEVLNMSETSAIKAFAIGPIKDYRRKGA